MLEDAARRRRDLDAGALPMRGPGDRPHGIITDRDTVMARVLLLDHNLVSDRLPRWHAMGGHCTVSLCSHTRC